MELTYNLIQGNNLSWPMPQVDCIFADPPDNIALGYSDWDDKRSEDEYVSLLYQWTAKFVDHAPIVWVSFNSRWTIQYANVIREIMIERPELEFKPAVQTFTFGQHNKRDLGNNHRPIWRLKHKDAPLYPDSIRVPSLRQTKYNDKRANPDGRVPGDVFDFPRVTGTSKQRRRWHPTQLHEDLVERAIKLSTKPGEHVLDPFGGTGTTLRVCKRIERSCTLFEIDGDYCTRIAEENGLKVTLPKVILA